MDAATELNLLPLTASLVAAYVSRNMVPVADLPAVINTVHAALGRQGQAGEDDEAAPVELKPAVPIKKSVTPEYIICLEDGKKMKMLKRHLMASYNMTPDEYRKKWNLPSDYPIVAPNYAKTRSALAMSIGLGRKRAS